MGSNEVRVAQRAIQEALVTSEKLDQCLEIKKLLQQNNIEFPLSEIILQKMMAEKQARLKYLQLALHELMIPEVRSMLDPYAIGISVEWENLLKQAKEKRKSATQRSICEDIQHDLDSLGFPFSLAHLLVLKHFAPPTQITQEKLPSVNKDHWKITLSSFCQREQKGEIIAIDASISQLFQKFFTREDLLQILHTKREMLRKWNLEIPFFHLLAARHKVEPIFLFAVIVAQLEIKNNVVKIRLGKSLLNKISVKETLAEKIQQMCSEIRPFIETSYRLAWLKFPMNQEREILFNLSNVIPQEHWSEARNLQKKLATQRFPLSLLKVLFIMDKVPPRILLAETASVIYQSSPSLEAVDVEETQPQQSSQEKTEPASESQQQEMLQSFSGSSLEERLSKTVELPMLDKWESSQKQKQEDPNTSKKQQQKTSSSLNTTVRLSPLDKWENTNKASENTKARPPSSKAPSKPPSKINKQLGSTMQLRMLDKWENTQKSFQDSSAVESKENSPDSEKLPGKTVAATRIINRLKRGQHKKTQQPEEPETSETPEIAESDKPKETVQVTLDRDMLLLNKILQENRVEPVQIMKAFLSNSELPKEERHKTISSVLLERGWLDAQEYQKLYEKLPEFERVRVTKFSNDLDLALANMLVKYNLLGRERAQHFIMLKSFLQKLSINKSLEDILVESKTLDREMIRSLLEGKKRKAKETPTIETQTHNIQPLQSAPKKQPLLSFAWPVLLLGALLFMMAGVYAAFVVEDSDKQQVTQNTSPQVPQPPKNVVKSQLSSSTGSTQGASTAKSKEEVSEQERIAKRMEAKNMEKWGEYWVPKSEKQALEQQWQEQHRSTWEIENPQLEIRYLERQVGNEPSYGIIATGGLKLPPFPKEKRLILKLALFSPLKNEIYEENRFFLTQDHQFRSFLGPFAKPLAPGPYFVRLFFDPGLQSPIIKRLLQAKRDREWWFSIQVGNNDNWPQFFQQHHQKSKALLEEVVQNQNNLKDFLAKEPEIRKQGWRVWSPAWKKEHEKILEELLQFSQQYKIPLLPKTWQEAKSVLNETYQAYQALRKHMEGLSLLPLAEQKLQADLEVSRKQLITIFQKEFQEIKSIYHSK